MFICGNDTVKKTPRQVGVRENKMQEAKQTRQRWPRLGAMMQEHRGPVQPLSECVLWAMLFFLSVSSPRFIVHNSHWPP